jgi:hypothetical protein
MTGEKALITKGEKNYIAGVAAIGGADAYRKCGEDGGMKTATCLKALKAKVGSTEDWGAKWAERMG